MADIVAFPCKESFLPVLMSQLLSWNSTAGKNWQIIDSNFHFILAEWIQSNFNQMLIISAERADHTWKKIANHWLFVSSIFIFFKCYYVTNIIWRHTREIMLQVIYLKLGCELSHHYHYSAINHYIIFISWLLLPLPLPYIHYHYNYHLPIHATADPFNLVSLVPNKIFACQPQTLH